MSYYCTLVSNITYGHLAVEYCGFEDGYDIQFAGCSDSYWVYDWGDTWK